MRVLVHAVLVAGVLFAGATAEEPEAPATRPLPTPEEFRGFCERIRADWQSGFYNLRVEKIHGLYRADFAWTVIPMPGLFPDPEGKFDAVTFLDGPAIELRFARRVNPTDTERAELEEAYARYRELLAGAYGDWVEREPDERSWVLPESRRCILCPPGGDARAGSIEVGLTKQKEGGGLESAPESILWCLYLEAVGPKSDKATPDEIASGAGLLVSKVLEVLAGLGARTDTPDAPGIFWTGKELIASGGLKPDDRWLRIDSTNLSLYRSGYSTEEPLDVVRALLFAEGARTVNLVRDGQPLEIRLDLKLDVEPLGGDCTAGTGRARLPSLGGTYEGGFTGGLPAGPGRLALDSGVLVIAYFKHGVPTLPALYIDSHRECVYRGSFVNGSLTNNVPLPAWRGPNGEEPFGMLDGFEVAPLTLARGELVAKHADTGLDEVRFAGLGVYTGRFVDGVAQGEGLLVKPDGSQQRLDCLQGIPALVANLIVANDRRMRFFETMGDRGRQMLPLGDCLQGNAVDGDGTVLMGREGLDKFVIYRGGLRNGRPQGYGELCTPTDRYTGTFENGERHGSFVVGPLLAVTDLSKYREEYDHNRLISWAPMVDLSSTPAAPEQPAARETRTYLEGCMQCGGKGYFYVTNTVVLDDGITDFMPGDRNFGSWNFHGYYDPKRVIKYDESHYEKCTGCEGRGCVYLEY